MKLLPFPGLEVRKSAISGKGCFTTQFLRKGRKVGEYQGERVSRREAKRRTEGRRIIRCVAIDYYWSIDASRVGNPTAFLNHSCRPNVRLRIRYGHLEFYALRDIRPGEEITLDYEHCQHPDTKRCTCGASGCRGTINRLD
jgi:uncharacterized protein